MNMARQAFVISDLHIGGGVDLDDFYQDAQFVEFIDAISQPDTTLIINGDFVDFAQIPPYETPEPFHLLWREQDSLRKLLKSIDSHSTAFYALARFVAKGAQVRIMIGNHDLDFVWPNVQAAFCQRLGLSSTDRVTFNIGHTIYDGVWIEHGHEFTLENCPVDPVKFIHLE
jgi:UDP-2,3-diacylglucosamine pyrophosphatase LpxH